MTTDEMVLASALELFSHKGYADTTINEIAKRANVNSLTIFRHFTDKKTLFLSVVEQYAEVAFDSGALDRRLTFRSLEEDLRLLMHSYFEIVFQNIHMMRIFIGESPYFEELRDCMWLVPPAVAEHCRGYLRRVRPEPDGDAHALDLVAELMLSYVARRTLEYNKLTSAWTLTPELMADFDAKAERETRCIATGLLGAAP